MSGNAMRLIADRRESKGTVAKCLREWGIEITVRELGGADYVLSTKNRVAVGRKAAADFVAAVVDRRLFAQLSRMQNEYRRAILIVEGDVFAMRGSLERGALEDALSWIPVIEGVALHHTSGPRETASMLCVMTRHARKRLGYDISVRSDKPRDRLSMAQFLVEGLPGVGVKTARRLLIRFGSAGAVFNASKEELSEVSGISKKAAARMRSSLDARIV